MEIGSELFGLKSLAERGFESRLLHHSLKTKGPMREFLRIMAKDILSENFTNREYVVYGVMAPVALFALMCLAGWLDSL